MFLSRGQGKVTLLSLLLSIFAFALPGFAQGPTTLSRTPWQMYRNPIITGLTLPSTIHGDPAFYVHAPAIPAVNANVPLVSGNGGWVAAPNGNTIGFNTVSRLPAGSCFKALDFTFFQTLVDIPLGTTISQFTISFSGMDDGSRITIFNSANPLGLVVPGSYVYLGGTVTANLASYVVAGQTNRVVVTQVDDCPVGNNLGVADVVLNGNVVPPAPPVTPPTFTIPFETPDGACICTPLLMNTNQNGTQQWYVKADGNGGTLTFKVAAVAVAPGIAETVNAQIVDMATNATVATVSASYSAAQAAPGFTAESVATVTATANAVYRVSVSTPGANPQQAHFRLKADGAQSIATGSPSAPSFEHDEVALYFNVAPGENLNARVFTAGAPPGAANMTFNYLLIDPNGVPMAPGSFTAPTAGFSQMISVLGATPGSWRLEIHSTEHYRIEKTSGADRGIYLTWQSSGEGDVTLRVVTPGGALFNQPVTFEVYNEFGEFIGNFDSANGEFHEPKATAGKYTVKLVNVPPGWSVDDTTFDVYVTCDGVALQEWVVRDAAPPTITMPPDVTLEAIGASGAPHDFTVTATDAIDGDVDIACTAASGDLFPLGPDDSPFTTTVSCTATDDAGNTASGSFNITVQDTTAPSLALPSNPVLEATSAAGRAFSFTPVSTDIVDPSVAISCTIPPAGYVYPLGLGGAPGVTTVTCTATDNAGNSTTGSFTVTVHDTTAPTGACTPSYNPSTKNIPRASRLNEDGFYVVSGSDTASAVTITIGGYTLQNGETVKFTQTPGLNGVVFVNNQGREPIRHFRVGPGDPVITVTDASGNTTTQTCYVPPIPK